jgi:hypothetical protein
MHSHCAFPGGDGKASFEGCGRSGESDIHGMGTNPFRTGLYLYSPRNMTSETHNP